MPDWPGLGRLLLLRGGHKLKQGADRAIQFVRCRTLIKRLWAWRPALEMADSALDALWEVSGTLSDENWMNLRS